MPLKKKRPGRPIQVDKAPVIYTLPDIHATTSMPDLARSLGLPYPSANGRSRTASVYAPNLQFHKPTSPIASDAGSLTSEQFPQRRGSAAPSIASLYTKPSMDALPVPSIPASPARAQSRRRTRARPPTMNLMVVGSSNSGKTSFLKTLLQTSDVPSNSHKAETLDKIAAFGCQGSRIQPTGQTEVLSVELVHDNERVVLTAIDTVGFSADDYAAEIAVNGFVRYLESKFAETLDQESQIIRSTVNGEDSHVHLVLYFVHPSSFRSSPPLVQPRTIKQNTLRSHKSMPSISRQSSLARSHTEEDDTVRLNGADERDEVEMVSMSRTDMRMIKKLAKRANVIPVIGHADSLTIMEIKEYKAAVLRDMQREGLDFGGLLRAKERTPSPQIPSEPSTPTTPMNEEDTMAAFSRHLDMPVDKPQLVRTRSRSNSTHRRTLHAVQATPPSTAMLSSHLPFLLLAPEDLQAERPEYVRNFRFGTARGLDPEHCDLALLKQTVLSGHSQMFRESTRDKLYEAYRMERLLVQRATQAQAPNGLL